MFIGIFTGLIGVLIIGLIWTIICYNGIDPGVIGVFGVLVGTIFGSILTHLLNQYSEKEKEKEELKILKRRIRHEIDLLSIKLGCLLEEIIKSKNIHEVLDLSLDEPAKSQDLFEKSEFFREYAYKIINFTDNSRSFLAPVESIYVQIDNLRLFLTEPEKYLPEKYLPEENYEEFTKPKLIEKVRIAINKIDILRTELEKIK